MDKPVQKYPKHLKVSGCSCSHRAARALSPTKTASAAAAAAATGAIFVKALVMHPRENVPEERPGSVKN